MKISKLFHWLYAILMFLPFGLVTFNCLHGLFSPSATSITFDTWFSDLFWIDNYFGSIGLTQTLNNVFTYLSYNIFGIDGSFGDYLPLLLTYWTCISIIWLVFDVFMYVPLLVHRWIDKAKLE